MRNTNDSTETQSVPGYLSVKEAAQVLKLSTSRVYEYVEDGRLPSVRAAHVILIPEKAVRTFAPTIAGRPRKSVPRWRISPENNLLFALTIMVQVREGCYATFLERLEEIKQDNRFLFPGTISRFLMVEQPVASSSPQVELLLVWRSTSMPDEEVRNQELALFQQTLEDVLDWDTAHYQQRQVLMHA